MHYNAPRDSEIELILVKEDHLPSQNVKAEDWRQKGLVPRLKFNEVITFRTGIYTYRQMLSIYFNRSDLRPAKLSFSSQEWCGQTFKEFLFGPKKAHLSFNSYWENEAKGERDLDWIEGAYPYNALPVVLRAMRPNEKKSVQLHLLTDVISNKVGTPKLIDANANFLGLKDGNLVVEVQIDGKKDQYQFSTDAMFPLLHIERGDGSHYQVEKRLVDDYWHHNRPGDEKLL